MKHSVTPSSGGTRGTADGVRTALVVDDEAASRETIAAILESEGYRTRCASSGEEGISMLGAAPFDVICTDYKMGTKSGLDVLRFAESLPRPVCGVLITGFREFFGHGAKDEKESGAASVAMLIKPFDPDELIACVRRAAQFTELKRISGRQTENAT